MYVKQRCVHCSKTCYQTLKHFDNIFATGGNNICFSFFPFHGRIEHRSIFKLLTTTWFLRYIFFYRNLQFLSHVIIIKTKVLLPHTWVTLADFGYSV